MSNPLSCEFVRLFHLHWTLAVGGALTVGLAAAGIWAAALGLLIGVSLFVMNVFFLYEAGRALMGAGSKGKGQAIAALSGIGRLLFLAVTLAFAARLGTQVLLFACGGLMLGQVNLHLAYCCKRRTTRCSST